MKKIIFLLVFTSNICYGLYIDEHPIYTQILKNNPNINSKYAMKVSNAIHKAAKNYKIDKHLLTAIITQESNFNMKAKNCVRGLNEEFVEVRACSDFGLTQINYRTIRSYNFDIVKLINDLQYSVDAGAKVLHDFKKMYGSREENWWVRYNCGSRGKTTKVTCRIYKELVERYL